MLILRIRFVHMEYCAFILVEALPIAWIAIGVLLLILLLIMSILWGLKSREVVTLKKQCEDLRETMRMMRYEEASLSRMLHTVSKPSQQKAVPALIEEETEEETEQITPLAVTEVVAEGVAVDSPKEEIEALTENSDSVENSVEEPTEGVVADDSAEEQEEVEVLSFTNEELEEPEVVGDDSDFSANLEEQKDVVDDLAEESEESVDVVEENIPSLSQSHKHPINERQPAIPTDLFAAWFAENEVAAENEVPTEEEFPAQSIDTNVVEEVVESAAIVDYEDVLKEEPSEVAVEEQVAELSSEVTIPEDEEDASEVTPVAQDAAFVTGLSKEDERFCRKLERIVNTRLRNPNLNIDIIAAQFGVGRTNFYRKVRELTGMSPNDYLRKCRMERAAELLRTSEQPISEVCAQVGIPDAQYFSRVFKSYYGMVPSAYREQKTIIS